MYRAIGWKAKREGIDPSDEKALADSVLANRSND